MRPAVNAGISVSRVGGKAQVPAIRKTAGSLRLDLAQYREKQSFSLFAGEVDKETLKQLERGALISEVLKQDKFKPLPLEDQIIIIFAAVNNYLDGLPLEKVKEFETKLIKYIRSSQPGLITKLPEFADETKAELGRQIAKFRETF
jgi:F-type H+-transporting ATPase subunit alpha